MNKTLFEHFLKELFLLKALREKGKVSFFRSYDTRSPSRAIANNNLSYVSL
jgi:hypothetical protein